MDENNKKNEFEVDEKKISSLEFFDWNLSMNRKTKNVKTMEEHIEKVLPVLEKNLSNFRLAMNKRYNTIQEYVRLLKLAKTEYQKLFNKNKRLKEKLEKKQKKRAKKRKFKKEETGTEIKSEELESEK